MKKSALFGKILSLVIAAALLFACIPAGTFTLKAAAAGTKLNMGIMSDVHYYPEQYMADTEAFEKFAKGGQKQYINEDGILESALAAFAKEAEENDLKYLVLPGDFTRNGEYEGHKALAKRLEQFEKDTGVEVMVINGNHDINNFEAASFESGEYSVSARETKPEEFKEIYKNLGYDLATAEFTPPKGEKAGMLSYVVELDGYRLIFIDGGKYSKDNTKAHKDSHETAGNYSDATYEWVLSQIKEGKKKGQTVIGVDHWSLVPHYESQARILQGFVLDNYLEVSESFADAGLHYMITGHSHSNDVSEHVNDNGEVIWDIETSSLMEFPHYLRTVSFETADNGDITFNYETHDVDCVLPVTSHGVTYEQPYRESFSFPYMYGNGIEGYVNTILEGFLGGFLNNIKNGGGLVNYINGLFDIEDFLYENYLGALAPQLMQFVNDLGAQIDERYINDPAFTFSVLEPIIKQLIDMPVSDLPCMALYEQYGYGDPTKPGTFGDAALVCMIQMAQGDEYNYDPFMLDVIDQFENGDLGERIFNKLYDLLVVQLAEDEILSNLYVNLDTLFKDTGVDPAGGYVQLVLDGLVMALGGADAQKIIKSAAYTKLGRDLSKGLGGTTYLELANAVLKVLDMVGVLEGGSVEGALEHVMEEYLTESQYESWGHTFAYIVADFAFDFDPDEQVDGNGTLVYSGKREVEVNTENYRAPALISVSLGNDSETTRNISWYSKNTLPETDIEIVEVKSGEPSFKGKTAYPSYLTVDASSEKKDREFPGVDLGIIGILPFTMHLQRHIVKIDGLKSDTTYAYRVGNAAKGWWSETGYIETADGSNDVTFLHLTDTQGQNPKQYKLVSDLLDAAYDLYPDTDLIVHSGDLVDEGSNLNYWNYFFSCNDKLLSTPLMPVSGNHEAKGENAIVDNFVLPDSKNQDTESGYYYSFDYNNVHFIMLNTNDSSSDGLGEAQLKWLKADARDSQAKWKIVVLHKALYSNGSHYDDSEVEAMRAQFASLMPELGIDMVLQGHDHVYLRTDAMNNNEIVDVDTTSVEFKSETYTAKVNPDGTVYAISGASGCKSYLVKDVDDTDELFPRAEKIVETDLPVFSGIRVSGNTLYFDAYTVDGTSAEKIDSFAIQKNATLGDADFDGTVTAGDAKAILEMVIGIQPYTEEEFKMCDVNHDKVISIEDVRITLAIAAGAI